MSANPLVDVFQSLDSYENMILEAPQDMRQPLRTYFPLPQLAQDLLEDTDEMGTHDLQDYIYNTYMRWNNLEEVPEMYRNLLESDGQPLIDQIIDLTDHILNRIRIRRRVLRELPANIYINQQPP